MRYVLVVGALASCTPTAAKVGLGVSGALVITGALVAAQPPKGLGPQPDDIGAALEIAGAIVAIPCIGRLVWPPPEPQAVPIDPAEARRREVRDRREQAWKLTQEAAAAATNGQCNLALDLGSRIADLDADFHDSVYLHTTAIARCMATPPRDP